MRRLTNSLEGKIHSRIDIRPASDPSGLGRGGRLWVYVVEESGHAALHLLQKHLCRAVFPDFALGALTYTLEEWGGVATTA